MSPCVCLTLHIFFLLKLFNMEHITCSYYLIRGQNGHLFILRKIVFSELIQS